MPVTSADNSLQLVVGTDGRLKTKHLDCASGKAALVADQLDAVRSAGNLNSEVSLGGHQHGVLFFVFEES